MNANAGTTETSSPSGVGASLAAAREAAGLSIDAVAQQLKLAPRQVVALETGDYKHLPGRTFVRGFTRNYARLLHLDPEKLLRELPAGAGSPALEAPTLQPTAPTIGELPTSEHGKPGWARWAIPALLAAVVIAAAIYEWQRPPAPSAPAETAAAPAATSAVTPAAIAPAGIAPAAVAPVAAGTVTPERPAPQPAPPPASSREGGTPLPNPFAAAAPAAGGVAVTPPAGTPAAQGTTIAATSVPEATVQLTFRDYSWTEIRDRDGRVMLARMNAGGTTQTVSGAPPLALVIGNAADVRVIYKSRAVDLAPYTRQNVARFTLP